MNLKTLVLVSAGLLAGLGIGHTVTVQYYLKDCGGQIEQAARAIEQRYDGYLSSLVDDNITNVKVYYDLSSGSDNSYSSAREMLKSRILENIILLKEMQQSEDFTRFANDKTKKQLEEHMIEAQKIFKR